MDVAIRPLRCPHCGAAVPFGSAPVAACAYCGVEVPVPKEYAAVQRSAQRFLEDRQMAQALYADLGRPPGRLLRLWGRGAEASLMWGARVALGLGVLLFAHPAVGVAAVLVVAFLVGYPTAQVIRGVAALAGDPVIGEVSPYLALGLGALFVVLLLGVPMLWLEREHALAPLRSDVHASLAAAPAEHPGGPARCWSCGAALDVPRGALGVPCSYCRADNLVALPAGWVSRVRSAEFRQFASIDAALSAYRQATARAQEGMWQMVFGFILVFPMVMLAAYILKVLQLTF